MSDQQAQELPSPEYLRGYSDGMTAAQRLAARSAQVERPDEQAIPTGCPEWRWDGPYRFRCGLGGDGGVCSVHGPFATRLPEQPDEPTGTPEESDVRFPVKLNDAYTCQGLDRDGEAVTFNDLLSEGDRVASVTDDDGNHFAPFGVVVRRQDGLWVEEAQVERPDEDALEAAKREVMRRAPRRVIFSDAQAEWIALGALAAARLPEQPDDGREHR